MEQFRSGWKRNYYGKGDVIAYKLYRDGNPPEGASPVFGVNVTMLLYGDAFWPTYTTGDNSSLVATDSMKNFIQRETMAFEGCDLESYCHFLGAKFLSTYPQAEGLQITATEIPYEGIAGGNVAFVPAGPTHAMAQIEMQQGGASHPIVDIRSGIRGFRLLRLRGSAFHGFVRDQYTTLPDIRNRPLQMWLDLEWTYTDPAAAFTNGGMTRRVHELVHQLFHSFESGSIQQIIYQIGTQMLDQMPEVAEVHLEANNRTWDTIVEAGEETGVYTDSRPPYGCLGLSLKR